MLTSAGLRVGNGSASSWGAWAKLGAFERNMFDSMTPLWKGCETKSSTKLDHELLLLQPKSMTSGPRNFGKAFKKVNSHGTLWGPGWGSGWHPLMVFLKVEDWAEEGGWREAGSILGEAGPIAYVIRIDVSRLWRAAFLGVLM